MTHLVNLAPWLTRSSGRCCHLSVLALHVVGDTSRDALDPRLRSEIQSLRQEEATMNTNDVNKESIISLFKGGRLPEWATLPPEPKRAYEQEHVDLTLSIAREHGLMRLEGFKLLGPQGRWKTFWITEFPTLAGVEAWITAEMTPPYSRYGTYEYYLARTYGKDRFSGWVTHPLPASAPPAGVDPHHVPKLDLDRSSYVALQFERLLPETYDATPAQRGDQEHIELMQSVAHQYGLMHLEAFQLIAPQPDWHRMWVIESPTLEGLEAWVEAEARPPHGRYASMAFHLARRWGVDYFPTWISR